MAPDAAAPGARPELRRIAAARRSVPVALLAVAVAIAFADSSVVMLALPALYGRFETTVEGVSWVVTGYNVAVALVALALVGGVRRADPRRVLTVGLLVFVLASAACAAAPSLPFLIAARCVQGAGAALLLAGSLPALGGLTGSASRGAAAWTLAGTFGAALGPALGGLVTEVLDWRAIFAVQAPLAAAGLLAGPLGRADLEPAEGRQRSLARTAPANVCLALLFGALVGALFLVVLLVITVWGYTPVAGAAIVSTLPAATLAVRPLARGLSGSAAAAGGATLLASGLAALALLPTPSVAYVVLALALCGAGMGLAVPLLTAGALASGAAMTRAGTLTVGARHAGLVLSLAVVAPFLAADLPPAGRHATLRATAVLLDAPVSLNKKVPVAIAVAKQFERARAGQVPDLAEPFDSHGARSDRSLADARNRLVTAVEQTIARAFRRSFLFAAALAAAAAAVAGAARRRALPLEGPR